MSERLFYFLETRRGLCLSYSYFVGVTNFIKGFRYHITMKIFPPKVSEGERLFRSFSGKSEERVLLWFLQRKKEYVPILDRPNTVLHWKMPDISERGMNLEEL